MTCSPYGRGKFAKEIFWGGGAAKPPLRPCGKAFLFILVKVVKFQPPWMAAVTINWGDKKLCFYTIFSPIFLYYVKGVLHKNTITHFTQYIYSIIHYFISPFFNVFILNIPTNFRGHGV
jgi:hypothetical protein